jgi:hypothetical protein
MIALTPVLKSSNIDSVGYSHTDHILAVVFKGGATWHYREVPQAVGAAMMDAVQQSNKAFEHGLAMDSEGVPSVGKLFATEIRWKYDSEKIETA